MFMALDKGRGYLGQFSEAFADGFLLEIIVKVGVNE